MTVAQGSPFLGNNATSAYTGNFIPEVWSGKIIESFYDASVLAAISNTDYEGEIKNFGDKVQIRTRPTISIEDYSLDIALLVERPSSTKLTLAIDTAKYFNTVVDDVIDVQADIDMLSMWADDASEQMKIAIDTQILADIAADASADNRGNTAGRISNNIDLGLANAGSGNLAISIASNTVIEHIIDMGQVLDEQNVPEQGRWLVIPAWMAARIKKSDLKDASISGDGTSIMRNGRLGMIDRFTLYLSNLLPVNSAETTIYAGTKHALTFASQMTKMETLRSERTFGTLMRGLQLYGWKVVKPEALVESVVKQG